MKILFKINVVTNVPVKIKIGQLREFRRRLWKNYDNVGEVGGPPRNLGVYTDGIPETRTTREVDFWTSGFIGEPTKREKGLCEQVFSR